MHPSRYVKIFPYKETPGYHLLFSTKQASVILLHESTLKSIGDGDLSQSDKDTLSELGFLVPDTNKEKEEMLGFIDEINEKKNRLNAVAVMNLDCNLGCRYCYEGGMKGKFYMSSETANLSIDFIERNYISNGKAVHLDFYGGEPLLSLELIKDISKRLKSSAEENGLSYTFGLVTNGTLLTGKIAEELASLGLQNAKVTIDGPKENHDRFRPFKTGSGSFDTIIRNIKEICSLIDIQIGGNYARENYRDFPQLLNYLLEEGLTPEKLFVVKFDPVTKTDGALPDFREGCESINEPWLFEASIFLREEILKRGYHTPKILPSTCMIELNNDIVVNFDGTIYKCPGLIGQEGFDVGDLKTGIKDYRESHNLEMWKNQECLHCEYLPLCFGGCRYMKLLRDGRIDGVDCRKPYLDATLEAFIRQDIKYRLKADQP